MKFRYLLVTVILGLSLLSTFPLITAGAGVMGEDPGFSDVSAKHQNVKAIDYLRDNKIVEGYEDGTFKPNSTINRAEFLKIVMEASDYELGGENCYPDVHDEWFAKYICAATNEGLVEGHPDGYFRPEGNINFAEASKIVANVLGLDVSDAQDDGSWFKSYVLALEGREAIPADIVRFNDDLTRGQMSEMIWRIKANRTYKQSKTYNNKNTNNKYKKKLCIL